VTARIKDIASIQIGCQFRKGVQADLFGTHWVIQVRDIDRHDRYRLDLSGLQRATPKADPSRYLVRNGDVLFLSKGRRNSATLVEQLPGGHDFIAAGYFFIVRPDTSRVRPDYLAWTINGPNCRAYLRSVARGSSMPFVPKDAFANMKIDLPDLMTQWKIVKVYELAARESHLLAELRQKRIELIQGFCTNAARATSRPAKE